MLLPEGILIYLITIMASLERAGERMRAVYAAHVVQNKINNYPRKWIKRTQRASLGNLSSLVMDQQVCKEFGHHQISHCSCTSLLAQNSHGHEVVSQQLLLLSTTAATPQVCASTGGILHWQEVYGHMFSWVSLSIKAPHPSLIYIRIHLYACTLCQCRSTAMQYSLRNTCLQALGMTS